MYANILETLTDNEQTADTPTKIVHMHATRETANHAIQGVQL